MKAVTATTQTRGNGSGTAPVAGVLPAGKAFCPDVRPRSRSRLALAVSCLAAAIVSCLGAHAAVLEYTYDLAQATSPFSDPEWTVAVDRFDVSLGTLTQVSITLSGRIVAEVRMENLAATANELQATWTTDMVLSQSATELVVTPLTAQQTHLFTSGYDGVTDYAGTSGVQYPNVTGPTGSQTYTTALPADLSTYTGSGTLDHTISAYGTDADYNFQIVSLSGKPQFAYVEGNFRVDGTVVVSYLYTPIPEPSGLALLALSALPALWRRRRSLSRPSP